MVISVFVNVGLICISTGNLEYIVNTFTGTCDSVLANNYERYGPEFECLSTGERFFWAVVVEHISLVILFVVYNTRKDEEEWVFKQRKVSLLISLPLSLPARARV